jgi:imidazolonepropionase-like amidohydrolase
MAHDPEVARRSLPLLLAHGITTALDPGGPTDVLLDLRDRIRDGDLTGPDLRVAGHVIDRTPFPGLATTVATPEDVRREVMRQADAGVDFIKLYATLSPERVAAGVAAAEARDIPVLIHPLLTTWTEAAKLGVDAVLHIIPGSPDLLPPAARDAFMVEMQRGTQFMFTWFELADLHGPVMTEAIAALAEEQIVVDPTLVFFDVTMRSDDPAVTDAEGLRWVAPSLLDNWQTSFHMSVGWTEEDFERARAVWPKMLELTRLLHEAGVPLAAGTDANNPWIIPGVSFHRELELLVEAGLPPLDVLEIATLGNARHVGVLVDRGTIEAGKRADLVLLRSDPREDISATRGIEWIMQAGTLRRPTELLTEVEAAGNVP